MNKERAFQVFLELSLALKNIPSRCIAIRPSNEGDFLSTGYKVYVPIFGTALYNLAILQDFVDKNQLALKIIDNQIIIYTPCDSACSC